MKDYYPWNDSWQYEIIHVLLPYQSNAPVEMGCNFTYPVFLEAINKGLKGEPFWKAVAGAMIYVMGHQPDHVQVPAYIYWLKRYNPFIVDELIFDGVESASANKLEKAIWIFQAAILLDPDRSESHFNLGLAYSELGMNLLKKKKKEEGECCLQLAAQYFMNALELDHNMDLAFYNLEYICHQMEIMDEGKKIEKTPLLGVQKEDSAKLMETGTS
ncbi:MAG TPA: hypothetical protein PLJ33_01260 [Peptococcaceae bacterium]|nr:hypothetical protein [Peptococcaceae bacterium]